MQTTDDSTAASNNIERTFAMMVELCQSANAAFKKETGNRIVTELLPLARAVALSAMNKARQYRQMQEDEYLSAAMEGLRWIVTHPEKVHPDSPKQFKSFCITVMQRRIADAQRTAIGRLTRRIVPHSLDAPAAGDMRITTWGDNILVTPSHVERVEMTEFIQKGGLDAIGEVLGRDTSQYKVLRVQMQYQPLGYSQNEMAEMLGISTGTFSSALRNARDKLKEEAPEIEEKIRDLFAGTPSDAIRRF